MHSVRVDDWFNVLLSLIYEGRLRLYERLSIHRRKQRYNNTTSLIMFKFTVSSAQPPSFNAYIERCRQDAKLMDSKDLKNAIQAEAKALASPEQFSIETLEHTRLRLSVYRSALANRQPVF